MKDNNYQKLHPKFIMGLFLFFSFLLFSQAFGQGKITGKINDTQGALPGVNVYLHGTTLGSSTNADGMYTIADVPAGSYKLEVRYVGYKSVVKSILVKNGQTLTENFVLHPDVLGLSEVVVTGVSNPVSKIQSSVSISSLNMKGIEESAPRSTAEIFRTVPGIRSESSGGDGNANITVRGVPISAGGSKYLQLQEDGLPLLQFGDIAFATSDMFVRADQTVARIEAIRGGSASTMASNSPAGIINFISKTGNVKGGNFSLTRGLDYRTSRIDFDYGSPITNKWRFNVGGFYRTGEGPRTAGYNGNNGGQVKLNITRLFDGGYARVYFKYLNDRAISYMPMPVKVTGTNDSPTYSSIPGFDITSGTMQSPYFLQNLGVGPNGNRRRSNIADGMHPLSTSFGIEFAKDFGNGWHFENRGRIALNSGVFVSPFPAEIGTGKSLAESIGGPGAMLKYTDGTPFGSGFSGNGLALRIHLFDTKLNNFNNIVNDFKISKKIDNLNLTAGYYFSKQSLSMSWLWNSYLTDLNGKDAKLLDVYKADGTKLSQNGLYAYGVPAWGNCCTRNYDTDYMTDAPYFSANVDINDAFNIDASVRYDYGHVTGSFSGTVQTKMDVNNDGTISPNEESVSVVDNANPTPVDYTYDYVSYSIGTNYELTSNQAVFARFSHGGSAKADRILFAGLPYTGGTTINAKDLIDQGELGYKQLFTNGGLYVTGFYASTTEEGGFEATTQKIIKNNYRAFGVEVEGAFNTGIFNARGGFTYTNAKITSGANDGNIPRRQPTIMFSFIPTVALGHHSVGLSFIGQTRSYTQDVNKLVMPAWVNVNAFVVLHITNNLYASVNANNLFDTLGFTESENASITNNQVNYVRARPNPGRSITLTMGVNL